MADLVPVDHDPFAAPSALNGPPPDDPRDFTSRYNTTLSPEQEQQYQGWIQQQPPNARNTYDYDMRGAFLSNTEASANQHYPDTFKKPNHPTFSDVSQYHGVDGYTGGVWTPPAQEGGGWGFTPGSTNLQIHGPERLQDYFQRVEQGNTLNLPPQPETTPEEFTTGGKQSALGETRPAGRFGGMAGMAAPTPVQEVTFGGEKAAAVTGGPGVSADTAKQMASQGKDADTIFSSTGWYRAPDGAWKFVIPDEGAKLNPTAFTTLTDGEMRLKPSKEPLTLAGIFSHPALFKAYPNLANATVEPVSDSDAMRGILGGYNPVANKISIAPAKGQDITSTILHELQHGIQKAEDFAAGGNSAMFLPKDFAVASRSVREKLNEAYDTALKPGLSPASLHIAIDAMQRPGQGQPMIPEVRQYHQSVIDEAAKTLGPEKFDKFVDAVKAKQRVNAMYDKAYDDYRRLGGETESRQVQHQYETRNWNERPTAIPRFPPATEQLIRRSTDPNGKQPTPGVQYHAVEYDPFARPSALGQEM